MRPVLHCGDESVQVPSGLHDIVAASQISGNAEQIIIYSCTGRPRSIK